MSTTSLAALVLALAATLATGTAQAAPISATTSTTSVRHVTPLTRAGHLRARYTVAATHRGHCWTTSLENGRLYRCLSGNFVLDPCWKESGRHSVVCLPVPWSRSVTRLRLTRRLPATATYRARLWGLRIGDGIGARCTASQGASFKVGGKWVSYFCGRGWVLTGRPDRRTEPWTMSTGRKVAGSCHATGVKHLSVAWKPVVG